MKTSVQSENILDTVFAKGCCLDLTIKTWQGRTTAKSFLDELGVENKPWSDKLLTGGQLKFISDDIRKSFHQYEVKARLWLEYNSYPFFNARFVPFTALDLLLNGDDERPGLKRMRSEFSMAVDEFIANFDKIRADYIDKMANVNAKYRKLLENYYPQVQKVEKKFEFDWVCYQVNSPIIYMNERLENRTREQILSSAECFLKIDAPSILNNKLYTALMKLFKVVDSKSTVKSSSLNAARKAIENFKILNISDNDSVLKFEQNLSEFENSISDIHNIDKSDDEKRNKVKTDLGKLLLQMK